MYTFDRIKDIFSELDIKLHPENYVHQKNIKKSISRDQSLMLFDSTAEYAPTSSTLFTSVYRYRPFPTLVYDNTQQCHIDIAEEQDADTDCFFDATEEFYENLEESLEEVAACTAHQAEAADSTLFLLQVKAPLLQTHKPYQ